MAIITQGAGSRSSSGSSKLSLMKRGGIRNPQGTDTINGGGAIHEFFFFGRAEGGYSHGGFGF